MSRHASVLVAVGMSVVASYALAEGESVYSGTFTESNGRKGPISCELTMKEDGTCTASFAAKNEGQGPNRPFACTAELAAKEADGALDLTGEVPMQRGAPYVLTAKVVDKKSMSATFKQKDGKGEGSFELAFGKADAAEKTEPAEKAGATE